MPENTDFAAAVESGEAIAALREDVKIALAIHEQVGLPEGERAVELEVLLKERAEHFAEVGPMMAELLLHFGSEETEPGEPGLLEIVLGELKDNSDAAADRKGVPRVERANHADIIADLLGTFACVLRLDDASDEAERLERDAYYAQAVPVMAALLLHLLNTRTILISEAMLALDAKERSSIEVDHDAGEDFLRAGLAYADAMAPLVSSLRDGSMTVGEAISKQHVSRAGLAMGAAALRLRGVIIEVGEAPDLIAVARTIDREMARSRAPSVEAVVVDNPGIAALLSKGQVPLTQARDVGATVTIPRALARRLYGSLSFARGCATGQAQYSAPASQGQRLGTFYETTIDGQLDALMQLASIRADEDLDD